MEPKAKIKRSRNGCHKCKSLKIKCDEAKPACSYCVKSRSVCDYSIKLTWGGRPFRDPSKRKAAAGPPVATGVFQIKKEPGPHSTVPSTAHSSPKDRSVDSPVVPRKRAAQSVKHEETSDKRARTDYNNHSLLEAAAPQTSVFPLSTFPPSTIASTPETTHDINQLPTASTRSPAAILENIPAIHDGMESLSHALSRMNGDHFQLQNSEIFNNFVISNMDAPEDSEITRIEQDYFSNYSEDLERINRAMPERKSNFVADTWAIPAHTHRAFQTTQVPEEDEEIEEIISPVLRNRRPFQPGEEHTHFLTPDEVFSSVPAQLLPLPELLLQVPFYRKLMHFWSEVACEHLVPAPAHIYQENPFKIILPQMAMEFPSILTTLLAFSATIRSSLFPTTGAQQAVINQLLARSCAELLKLLKDKKKATADPALATVLLLSCYEVFSSRDFDKHRVHIIGARQIVKARTSKSGDGWYREDEHTTNMGSEGDITFFLMRWFVYIDIIGALSATKNSHNYLASSGETDYGPAKSVEIANQQMEETAKDPKRDIDHLLGFDVKFLPHFSQIALLIRKTDSYLSSHDASADRIPIEIVTAALEIKDSLMRAYEAGEKRRQQKLDEIIDHKIQQKKENSSSTSPPNLSNLIQQDNILRSTNKMFCYTGIISLYRRVLRIPRVSTLVQELADSIAEIGQEHIEPQSSADICSIFCSFTAGCETLEEANRLYFFDKFTRLISMGNVNAMKSLKIMQRCWETGEDWIDASTFLDIDLALL